MLAVFWFVVPVQNGLRLHVQFRANEKWLIAVVRVAPKIELPNIKGGS
jgi:hypothetical protein